MAKKVVILVGLAGSGKSLAAKYLKKKGLAVLRMGELTEEILDNKRRKDSEKNEREVRINLRKEFGPDIYARNVVSKHLKVLKQNELVVIDGMRSPEEWEFFSKNLDNPRIYFLVSEKSVRIERLVNREIRPLTLPEIEKRDGYENRVLGIGKLKKLARAIIHNNSTAEDFFLKLDKEIC